MQQDYEYKHSRTCRFIAEVNAELMQYVTTFDSTDAASQL